MDNFLASSGKNWDCKLIHLLKYVMRDHCIISKWSILVLSLPQKHTLVWFLSCFYHNHGTDLTKPR